MSECQNATQAKSNVTPQATQGPTHDIQQALDIAFGGKPYTLHGKVFDTTGVEARASNKPIAERDWKGKQFICLNPIKSGHTPSPRSEGVKVFQRFPNVECFQNWVVEVDGLIPDEIGWDAWREGMAKAIKPLDDIGSLWVYTGNKSVHVWLCSQEPVDYETWRNVGEALLKLVPEADKGVLRTPTKLVRLPGGTRDNGREQQILGMQPARPFGDIKAFLVSKGVWDDNAFAPKNLDRVEALAQWEKKHPIQAAVRLWLKEQWGWKGERSAAQHRGGDNETAMVDLGACAYDHKDAVGWSWVDLAHEWAEGDSHLVAELQRFMDAQRKKLDDLNAQATANIRAIQEQTRMDKPLPFISAAALISRHPTLRPELIRGLLRQGETMNVIASPKTGKSWLVLDLALSVATGRDWLGHPVSRGDVLIIDNELHPATLSNRLPKVADARSITLSDYGNRIRLWPLRGHLHDLESIGETLRRVPKDMFKLVILDAFYRFLPKDGDENSNAMMANLYNVIDGYADTLNCSIVVIHHTTKGTQHEKEVTDVGAGAGSQARATDTHLVLRRHAEDGCVAMHAVVRSNPPPEPVVLRWSFPVWNVDTTGLDPTDLRSGRKKTQPKPETPWTPERFADELLGGNPPLTREQVQDEADKAGLSERRTSRLLKQCEGLGLVGRIKTASTEPHKYQKLVKPTIEGSLAKECPLHTHPPYPPCGAEAAAPTGGCGHHTCLSSA